MNSALRWSRRIRQLVARETMKTIRRPVRLVAIPYFLLQPYLIRILSLLTTIFAPLFTPVVQMLPLRLLTKRTREMLSCMYFTNAAKLLDDNRPQHAWPYFQRCLADSTDPNYYFTAAVCLMQGLGRYREAMAVLARANALRAEKARALGIADSPIRFLDNIWSGAFGHLAELQYLIKLNILENRQPKDTIHYIPRGAYLANRFLLEQWRPYLTIIENEADLPLPLETLRTLSFDFLGPRLADGSTAYHWEIAERVNRQWQTENRGPILAFPPDVEERGFAALRAAGMPRDAWFVAMHVRESSSKRHHSGLHNVLNGRLPDYLPAIKEITDRGGWVIRLGDSTMTALPALPHVIDYCHSSWRSDWMDIFLLARGRFFLGTSSGPAYVPIMYQVPTVLTNWWPPAQRPWDDRAIFVLKLYRDVRTGAPLTLSRSLSEPFGYCNSVDQLRQSAQVRVQDNTPEDIRDAVIEMFERLEGTARYTAEDLNLRERACRIFEVNRAHGTGTLAREFVRRNRNIIE